jgi:hypothetical protein
MSHAFWASIILAFGFAALAILIGAIDKLK